MPKLSSLDCIFSTPTAPFREDFIRGFLSTWLRERRVPHYVEDCGNVVVGVASERELRRTLAASRAPLTLFIAHMDHPGFVVTGRSSARRFRFRWNGGGPIKALAGARLWLADAEGRRVGARLLKARLHKSGRWMIDGEAECDDAEFLGRPTADLKLLFGGFDFGREARLRGTRLYMNAADDLAGAFALCRAFEGPRKKGVTAIGLLTVAEEVGWVGCIDHFQRIPWGDARRQVTAVSLEASRTLEGARLGAGPVVRLGDKSSAFDPAAGEVLIARARAVLGKRHQARVMDGGTCEGYVTGAWGVRTIGLCVPLGNYHNQSLDGGPQASKTPQGPAPEFVDMNDLEGMAKLCRDLAVKPLDLGDPYVGRRKKLAQTWSRYRRYL